METDESTASVGAALVVEELDKVQHPGPNSRGSDIGVAALLLLGHAADVKRMPSEFGPGGFSQPLGDVATDLARDRSPEDRDNLGIDLLDGGEFFEDLVLEAVGARHEKVHGGRTEPLSDQFIDLAMLLEPRRIASFGVFCGFSDQLDGLGFVARLARVVDRDDHLEVERHDIATAAHQTRDLDTLARDSHCSPPIKEVDRHQLRDARLR
ncbi:hypothetical protein [Aquisphaera insulae]|uniref:hypothetical protein n=1 Tax=Aquisphaera insulae TaxID=2712864 RepID=UPI0013EE310F|nr:hypothetical protein [Aquisphaera insulae]